eukprot:121829_1
MRRSKASSQGKGDGERKSNGGTEMSSDSSPSSITPGGEKRSKGGMMCGGGLQSRIPNRRQSVMNRIFGRGVVLMICALAVLWRKHGGPILGRLWNKNPSPLSIITDHAMSWTTSTTSAPISKASILVKDMLGFDDGEKQLHTVSVDEVRRILEKQALIALEKACGDPDQSRCRVNDRDEFGLTALHVASFQGDEKVASFLMEHGANPEIEDSVGRKPRNMTFGAFVKNAKVAAMKRGSECQIPEVIIPQPDLGDSAANLAAFKEVKRLISEGEPVIVRGLEKWLQRNEKILYPDAHTFVSKHKDHGTIAASVPYAGKFNVPVYPMTLGEFYEQHIKVKKPRGKDGDEVLERTDHPLYTFEQDGEACHEGFRLLSDFVHHAVPLKGDGVGSILDKGIMCDPSIAGLRAMHYYIGNTGTGAPFHIHSDAINVVLKGRKRWWVVPPRAATFSKMHISDWMKNNGQEVPPKRSDTLECTQGPGDVVYVPFDWGHAAINEEGETFGYTMELTNRRDAYMTAMTHKRSC